MSAFRLAGRGRQPSVSGHAAGATTGFPPCAGRAIECNVPSHWVIPMKTGTQATGPHGVGRSAVDVLLQLLDDELLVGDDGFHQIAL